MRSRNPQPKYNLDTKKTDELVSIFQYFHYMEFGKKAVRLKVAVPQLKIHPKFWDKRTQRATLNRSAPNHHIKINAQIDEMTKATVEIYRDFNAGCISVKDFSQELNYRMKWQPRPIAEEIQTTPTLFEFIDIFIKERAHGKRGTEKILKTWDAILRDFCLSYYKRLLDYNEINAAFFAAFQKWCYKNRQHSINYFHKGSTIIRQFMREAERRKYHTNRDYEFFAVKRTPTTQIALTFSELEALEKLDLANQPEMEKTRDLFLVGAYTGLRYSEFNRLKPEHIETNSDGIQIISITTQKTGTLVAIPLLPIPKKILEKYSFTPPSVSDQIMNRRLKALGKLIGVNEDIVVINTTGGTRKDEVKKRWELLSTHVARRSFATNFYRDGIPASVLMMITGHSTEKQFLQYVKIGVKENATRFAELAEQKKSPLKIVSKSA
jgi:integrase